MSEEETKIIKRMSDTDDYVVRGTGGHFWANESHRGCLIETCYSEEVYIIQKLAREGRGIVMETKSFRV